MSEREGIRDNVTVACVNWAGTWGDKAANLEKMKSRVTEAAQYGANIIAFPELALSGYECSEEARRDGKPCAMHIAAAETIPGPSTDEIASLSEKLGVYVIFGMPEKDENKQVHYISAAITGPKGLVGRYRKINLGRPPYNTESVCFKSGNEVPVFDTEYGRIGVQICRDFWLVPELSRILFLKGAQLIINISGSVARPGVTELVPGQTESRAAESLVYVATANMTGKERTLTYAGHSTIAGPSLNCRGKIYAKGGVAEEIVMATLNIKNLEHAQSLVNAREEVNWKLIAWEYAGLAGISAAGK